MAGGSLDAGNGGLQVIECSATTRTTDVFGAGGALARGLQNSKSRGIDVGISHALRLALIVVEEEDTICQSVEQQCAEIGRRLDLEIFFLVGTVSTLLEEYYGILEVFCPHLVYQSPQFAQSVLVIALRNNDHLGVEAETHFHFLIEGRIGEEQEFERTRIHTDERQRLVSISRVHSLLWLPHVGIHDVGRFYTFVKRR